MTIKTRYELGETLCFLGSDKKIHTSAPVHIDIQVNSDGSKVSYVFKELGVVSEEECFKSRELLINSL